VWATARRLPGLPDLGEGVPWLYALSLGGRHLAAAYRDGHSAVWDIIKREPVISDIPGGYCGRFQPRRPNLHCVLPRTVNCGGSA